MLYDKFLEELQLLLVILLPKDNKFDRNYIEKVLIYSDFYIQN